jgi:hypothetical protein
VTGRSEIKERRAGPTLSFRAALSEAAELIQEVLDTAESAAVRIVEDAEDRARRIRQDAEADAERGFRGPGSVGSADGEERSLARRLEEALDLMTEVAAGAELTARDADALRSLASSLRANLARPVSGLADHRSSTSTPKDAEHDERPADPVEGTAHGTSEDRASREHASVPPGSPPGDLADAELLAVQMALAGRSDDEIERRLRQQFGDREVDLALDVVGKLGADRR